MAQHLSKKRRIVQATESHNARENAQPITSARILQDLMADYSGSGVRQFRDFLNRCSEGPDVKEDEATRNRGFLKAYLEAQSKNWRNDQADGTEESVAFVDVTQIWSYAFQNNSGHLLTFLPASLAILVRLCSYHEELRTYGTILIHSLLQQANLKIVYKCLGGNKDYHISPCLRLLVEMNRFNFGALCGQVHSSFDFTIKDLVKAFEVRGSTKNEIEDPTKPSIRTQAVRFFISFLQNGEPSVRNAMLGLKTWISAIFKHLKADSPAVVSELLDSLSKRVINEKEIPRATKTNVFNEWVLAHILSLYSRNELVKVSRGGKDDDKKVSELAHEFLLTVCTTPGNGICFLDQGWYPPGYAGVDEKRGAHKVYNRALASFASSVRPYADTSQLDLLLDIFKTCPEIIANHFLSNSPFGFEPKLTATWIGYCTFLSSVISLPVPRNFGSSKDLAVPPPASIIIENILPQPLSKVVMSKCLTHTNKLIKFLSTRLLITSFQKLGAVLEAIDAADASMYDPTGIWKNCRSNVVEEFCKRIPDIQSLGAKPESNGVLQSEAHSRLLAEYYSKIPEISFTGKFDINFALSELLSKDLNDDNKKGILLVEMGHLLRIATEIPDVKWWNKTPSMLHSPFVSILKLCCSSSSGGSLLQVYDLLQSFASKSYLFQDTTLCSPLEALIESLSAVTDKVTLEAILSMLDEVIARCIRGPFKYCDDFTELAMELWKDTPGREEVPPVSPFVMALAEQWKFFGKEISIQQKTNGAMWFIRFLDSCALLGENRQVIGALCERVSADTQEKDIQNLFMKAVEFFKNTEPAQIVPGKKTNLILGRYFSDGQEYVNPEVILEILQAVQNGKIEPSLFRLIILQKVCISIAKGSNDPVLNPNGPREVISHINDLMKYTVLQLNEKVASVEEAKITKIFLAKRAETLAELIGSLPETTWVWLDIFHGLVELMCATFGENDLISFEKARRALPIGILKVMEYVEKQYKTISEPDLRRLVSDMRSLLSLNLDSQDLDDAIHNISQVFISTRASPVLGSILKRHCDNGDVISNVTISRILKTPGISDDILLILLKYISNTPVIHLEKIAWHQSTHQLIDIECALIRKVEGFRARIMESLDLYVEREVSGVQNGTARFAALLEGHSRYVSEENKFIWDPATSPVHKAKFLENYIRLQNQFLDENLNETQLRFFLCAVCLLPGIDQKAILDRITGDRKKSNLWASTVLLINKIVESPEELFSAKMKAWFLFSFDHLTRRFAEDSVLSEKVLDFAKRLGSFIEHRQIALDKLVPRTALNAVLEAAIVKHIQVKETVYFSTAVISQSPSKILDLPKFLQLILGNSESPLAQRGAFTHTLPEEIHGYVVYLTSKIFWASKQTASNLATMDATLELYRGTDDPIDRSLLEILLFIESHLAKSCAGRISSWKVVENAGPQPLISRARGRLNVTIDSKKLQTSIYQLAPIKQGNTAVECSDLATFSSSCMESSTGKCYDPKFLLPALTYCITSGDAEMDFQAAVDKHGVGYALVCLCSVDLTIRKMAIGYIGTVVSKIESSSSRNKTQINHLLCTVLASLEAASEDNQTQDTPLPTVVGIFLSQALQVLSNPAHFLYEKVMELLLRSPILNLYDIPYMLTLLQIGSEPHKEIAWIMKILAAGIKTPADLALYRKRNVFTSCMNLHSSPFMPERIKDKVIELVWNTAAVEGGSTTLITRNGALSWIEQLLIVDAVPEEKRLQTKMLAARLWESSAKGHVGEWSKGTVKQQLSEILQTPKNTSAV